MTANNTTSAPSTPHPDAALLLLGAQFRGALKAYEIAAEAQEEAELQVRRGAAPEAVGLAALVETTDRMAAALDAIDQGIISARATTLEGLRVKAALIAAYGQRPDPDETCLETVAMWSLVADLVPEAAQ